MKILIVGAGAVGGYFGARLLQSDKDVTFLVRPKRKSQLEKTGLMVESPKGNTVQHPTMIDKNANGTYDVILLSTKAYHLETAVQDVLPFIHEETMIIPLLNGMAHMDTLLEYVEPYNLLGGVCFIESTLKSDGTISHLEGMQTMLFGERSGELTDRVKRLEALFSGTIADMRLRTNIMSDMWQKYMLITVLSGTTTIFDASVGQIKTSEAALKFTYRYMKEVAALIHKIDPNMDPDHLEAKAHRQWAHVEHAFKASMQKDKEKGGKVEADHIQGYLLKRAQELELEVPSLETVYANLKIYEQKERMNLHDTSSSFTSK